MQKYLFSRLWQYQKERFPFIAHGILIFSFTFSAIAYSHICRNANLFISTKQLLIAFANTFFLFLLLRISDEFKDKEFDAKNRPHLPVPRGLVNLQELKKIGILILISLTLFNLIFAFKHFYIYIFVLIYMFLMFNEFFVKQWLEKNQIFYVASHMLIIPLVDTLASSFDWMGTQPDLKGLVWFFFLSFFNGLTLELGRKIKSKNKEEANSYSFSLGFKKAMILFQVIIFITFLLCLGASFYARLLIVNIWFFIILYLFSSIFGIYYFYNQTDKNCKIFEILTGIWAIGMYLNLGSTIFFNP